MLVLSVAASTTAHTPTESETTFNHDRIHRNGCAGHRLVAVFVRDHRKVSKVYQYSRICQALYGWSDRAALWSAKQKSRAHERTLQPLRPWKGYQALSLIVADCCRKVGTI